MVVQLGVIHRRYRARHIRRLNKRGTRVHETRLRRRVWQAAHTRIIQYKRQPSFELSPVTYYTNMSSEVAPAKTIPENIEEDEKVTTHMLAIAKFLLTWIFRNALELYDYEKTKGGPELDKRNTYNNLSAAVENMNKLMYRRQWKCRQLPERLPEKTDCCATCSRKWARMTT